MDRGLLPWICSFGLAALAGCASGNDAVPGAGGESTSTGATSAETSAGGGGGASASSAASATAASSTSATTGGGGDGGASGTGGSGPSADWSCVGNVAWEQPSTTSIMVALGLVDFGDQNAPLIGINVKACARSDMDCSTPLGTGTTDSAGEVFFILPTGVDGFDGYFEATGSNIPTSLVFVVPPSVKDHAIKSPLLTDSMVTLLGSFGIEMDPARGNIALAVLDCATSPAAGVEVSASAADGQTQTVYIAGGLPTLSATQTDVSGVAAFFGLPPGTTMLKANDAATGKQTGSVSLFTRAGAFGYAVLPPTP